MKEQPFNVCPTCIYNTTCVLTALKSQVWSCSEYNEASNTDILSVLANNTNEKENQPELVLV